LRVISVPPPRLLRSLGHLGGRFLKRHCERGEMLDPLAGHHYGNRRSTSLGILAPASQTAQRRRVHYLRRDGRAVLVMILAIGGRSVAAAACAVPPSS
jgi:hypothetical protein